MLKLKQLLSVTFALLLTFSLANAQTEHPSGEHPASKEKSQEHPEGSEHPAGEHPEHPQDKAAEQALTVEEFADAAEKYIRQETVANDGYFIVRDEQQEQDLKLKLIKIHRERLAHLGDNTYFVCADFEGEDGNTYDIDIFMTGTSEDDLKATRTPMVHKVNGEERFNWYKNDEGVWERKSVK